ncbi:transmembrane protein, putative (macronuclear) [Tetrahymena thermophila SB210]|uniref:Transmembrane protein, putative n=1 Tax=Tetrahymena thermophila (strain SB210) TaxID=312017 RepID=I7M2S1_TETTS|nr:transmembrane protein, putative [Tetrahymena thermophila SB210]EAS01187.2 transmembrane protein, putative [Tetrahymena thermophila SB210]|eukprot:XP_001021432.2 transmembrane protein, putative [Tetrahymena thermophila SB210]
MDLNPVDTQKQLILRNEFAQIDIAHNKPLSRTDIEFAMDKKLNDQTFDRYILEQLFDQITYKKDHPITIDEFIRVYLNAERVLIQKIEQSKEYLQNYQRQARETKNKIQIIKTKEKINDHGISEDSVFNFNVISAIIQSQELNSDCQTFVLINCGQNERKTDPATSLFPQFNYSNSFQIETGDENIVFSLIDNISNNVIGFAQLNISDLKNQQMFDIELQLQKENGINIGFLKVKMQWIHSKVKYLEGVVNQWEEYAAAQSQDLEDYQRDLLTLYEPFQQLQAYNRNQLNQNTYQGIPSNTNPFDEGQMQVNQYQGAQRNTSYKASLPEMNQLNPDRNYASNGLLNPASQDYKKIAYNATIGYLIMVLLISFARPMFFDLLIIFYYCDYQIKEEFTGQVYKYFTIAVFISFVVFDLGWIINFTKDWFSGDFPDNGMKYFVDLLTILLFLYKLLLMVVYILNWNYYEQVQSQINNKASLNMLTQQQLQQQQQFQGGNNFMNQSNNLQYPQNNYLNNQILGNLNNPEFNQYAPGVQSFPDTMKVTSHY